MRDVSEELIEIMKSKNIRFSPCEGILGDNPSELNNPLMLVIFPNENPTEKEIQDVKKIFDKHYGLVKNIEKEKYCQNNLFHYFFA